MTTQQKRPDRKGDLGVMARRVASESLHDGQPPAYGGRGVIGCAAR